MVVCVRVCMYMYIQILIVLSCRQSLDLSLNYVGDEGGNAVAIQWIYYLCNG